MGYIFISYSRRQLYFAEAVALYLQRTGLEVWFDLQKLTPGIEWETALRNGREVIIVLSEAVLLPEVLRGYPVYAARAHFDRTIQNLIVYLRGNEPARHDPVPVPGKYLPTLNMPFDIRFTLFAMFVPTLAVWIATLTIPPTTVDFSSYLDFITQYLPGLPAQKILFYLAGLLLGAYLSCTTH